MDPLSKLLVGFEDCEYIVNGVKEGFSLGFCGEPSEVRSNNAKSVESNLEATVHKIMGELALGRIKGPFDIPPFDNFKQPPLALREKSEKGKFRLLHNLSYPYDENAVNFNIPQHHYKLKYQCIDDALTLIKHLPQCYLAKADIQDAFRILPLSPSCYNLVGFKLLGKYFHDCCLPMGARSSCKIFETFSSSLVYALKTHYNVHNVVKVLDDFIFIGKDEKDCKRQLDSFKDLCARVNVPLAARKTVEPCKNLVFLGFQLNMEENSISIPAVKVCEYTENIQACMKAKSITLRRLKSIIGKLQFCTAIIPSGRCFLRRLHDRTIGVRSPGSFIFLTKDVKADLALWRDFLKDFNGREIIENLKGDNCKKIVITTDSSGHGFGGIIFNRFIIGTFPARWRRFSIATLELFPVYALVCMLAHEWCHSKINFFCDNQAVVHILNQQTSKNKRIMSLLRPMVALSLRHRFTWEAFHVAGVLNVECDALSRGQIPINIWDRKGLKMSQLVLPEMIWPLNLKL